MARCCDQLNFTWQQDGEDQQALMCGGCGARWEPVSESTEDNADIKEALGMFRGRLSEKKTWGKSALDELMLDCLLNSGKV